MMGRIRKAYYTLDELVEIWRFSEADLRYVVENDLLGLSVRLVGPHMEIGEYDSLGDGEWASVPLEHRRYDGLVDLYKRDAIALLRDERVEAARFAMGATGYAKLLGDEACVVINRADVLIRTEERRRFELDIMPSLVAPAEANISFETFAYRNRAYRFTATQARVLLYLFEAAQSGAPWQPGKVALSAAGSNSVKMSDLFKRRPGWRDIVEHDGRGSYRLACDLAVQLAA
jgi:hypothetical protein